MATVCTQGGQTAQLFPETFETRTDKRIQISHWTAWAVREGYARIGGWNRCRVYASSVPIGGCVEPDVTDQTVDSIAQPWPIREVANLALGHDMARPDEHFGAKFAEVMTRTKTIDDNGKNDGTKWEAGQGDKLLRSTCPLRRVENVFGTKFGRFAPSMPVNPCMQNAFCLRINTKAAGA